MLIKLPQVKEKFNLNIKGIIHVGAHHGEEYEDYKACGVEYIAFIEPCTPAFKVLADKFTLNRDVALFNCALGDRTGMERMHVEEANSGSSNSLLKPALHLKQYWNIPFVGEEMVDLRRLDDLELDRTKYNMINMDVQGYELWVVKGGSETLKGIDIIYSEVNRDELYEGCTRVEQLDEFLGQFGFERVATDWGGETWGDAVYLKKS